MTAKELEKAMMKKYSYPLIKLKNISEMIGDSNPQRVKQKYLVGLKSLHNMYFVPEVAERIAGRMR